MADEVLVITETEQLVLQGEVTVELIDLTQAAEIIEVAEQGPPGPPGPTGPPGATAQTAIAGEALGGHRAVVLAASGSVFYADCGTPAHFGRLAGVTNGAAAEGDTATIVNNGVMVEPSWAWVEDAHVFLGHTGLLTQTAPGDGFQQVVGMALGATILFINPREPVITI